MIRKILILVSITLILTSNQLVYAGPKGLIQAFGCLSLLVGVCGADTHSHLHSLARMGIVADLDTRSKVEEKGSIYWKSVFREGVVSLSSDSSGALQYSIQWGADKMLSSKLNEDGRGMELSELVHWNGKLLAADDRTGVVFEITDRYKAVPRFILMEGDGESTKGQKSEWATVKDGDLYIGSFGREFIDHDGSVSGTSQMWVAKIEPSGKISREDWSKRYEVLRKAAGAEHPGYISNEAIHFDEKARNWIILPRRVSRELYNEVDDEMRGSNLVMVVDENFQIVERKMYVGQQIDLRGWSSFKFLPNTNNTVGIGIRTEEEEGKRTGVILQRSFITLFRLSDGVVLMPETLISGEMKFEGLEILNTWSAQSAAMYGAFGLDL